MLSELFNENPNSTLLQSYLTKVASSAGVTLPEPEVKTYPDAVYFNYYTLGISLQFIPRKGRTTTSDFEALSLDGIDIYNTSKDAFLGKGKTYSQFPLLPMRLTTHAVEHGTSPNQFELKAETTGQDLVQNLGEPTRKGGGAGPSTGSISIWCEWSKLGIMIEFGGDQARGPQAWERGKDAIWKIVTLFPKDTR
ncbi:hypothetical protein JB92DRAFT_2945592 [Gautieria morchelliformis]|nr:hypothetical protein JB92DRAFT_2945592 [Gautieria morchelliformis]